MDLLMTPFRNRDHVLMGTRIHLSYGRDERSWPWRFSAHGVLLCLGMLGGRLIHQSNLIKLPSDLITIEAVCAYNYQVNIEGCSTSLGDHVRNVFPRPEAS